MTKCWACGATAKDNGLCEKCEELNRERSSLDFAARLMVKLGLWENVECEQHGSLAWHGHVFCPFCTGVFRLDGTACPFCGAPVIGCAISLCPRCAYEVLDAADHEECKPILVEMAEGEDTDATTR